MESCFKNSGNGQADCGLLCMRPPGLHGWVAAHRGQNELFRFDPSRIVFVSGNFRASADNRHFELINRVSMKL